MCAASGLSRQYSVRFRDERSRQNEAQALSGTLVNCKVVPTGKVDRQLSWLRPSKDFIDIARRLAKLLLLVWRPCHQPPGFDEERRLVDGGQAVLRREVHDELTIAERQPALEIREPLHAVIRNGSECRLQLGRGCGPVGFHRQAKRLGGSASWASWPPRPGVVESSATRDTLGAA